MSVPQLETSQTGSEQELNASTRLALQTFCSSQQCSSATLKKNTEGTDTENSRAPLGTHNQQRMAVIALSGLCAVHLSIGCAMIVIGELERRRIVTAQNLSNYFLTIVLVPYCTWILSSLALNRILHRAFGTPGDDVINHWQGEEIRALRRMLLRCVDAFMIIPPLIYVLVQVFLCDSSAEFFQQSGFIARVTVLSGLCIEFAELGTFNSDWDIPTHHVGELVVTLASIEWSSMNRESGLFILTLMTGLDRCVYFYFFLAKLRYLREKYDCCIPREPRCQSAPASVQKSSSEPIAGVGLQAMQITDGLLLDFSPGALRLVARICLVYYTLFVRGGICGLLITHIILKRDAMPLGWQIAILPAFLVFISVDLPIVAVMWKRSLKVREQRAASIS